MLREILLIIRKTMCQSIKECDKLYRLWLNVFFI